MSERDSICRWASFECAVVAAVDRPGERVSLAEMKKSVDSTDNWVVVD